MSPVSQTTRTTGQAGFTLLELLVAIGILGMLSGVAVAGVGTIQSNAQRSRCDADADTIRTAEEAALVQGSYLPEADLVAGGILAEESTGYDITVSGGDYELVPVGECAQATETTVTPSSTPSSTTIPPASSTSASTTVPVAVARQRAEQVRRDRERDARLARQRAEQVRRDRERDARLARQRAEQVRRDRERDARLARQRAEQIRRDRERAERR